MKKGSHLWINTTGQKNTSAAELIHHGCHPCTQMKEPGLRIRVENDLREAFLTACKDEDKTAAQVLRAFMRSYVDERGGLQSDLFRRFAKEEIKYGERE